MINYTQSITRLMQDIVRRVPQLSFLDLDELVVFGRFGRSGAAGAFATCHCLNLPATEPGYYFWRDRATGRVTRRSPWFVTKTPVVRVRSRRVKYLISVALPRFCDQTLKSSSKADLYPGAEPWVAKLDTVVHELYHIDPREAGLRRIMRADGSYSPRSHGREFYEEVARMAKVYLRSNPRPELVEFLQYDFAELERVYGGVLATTFRNYPSFPQQYPQVLRRQPEALAGRVVPIKGPLQPPRYTERDLAVRRFLPNATRQLNGHTVMVQPGALSIQGAAPGA